MTLAEIIRYIDSKKRVQKQELQEKAVFDYTLADLIGRSISRMYSSSNRVPDIEDVYPTLFDAKEIKIQQQKKQQELSVLRFKQFADSYNKRFKGVANE